MSQNQNALERLMNRSKPKVPPREDTVLPETDKNPVSVSNIVSEVVSLDVKAKRLNDNFGSQSHTQHNEFLEQLEKLENPSAKSEDTMPEQVSTFEPSIAPQSITNSLEAKPEPNNTFSSLDIKTSLSQDKITSKDFKKTFNTRRNTTRLDETIDELLDELCNRQKITKETWFEAAYLYFSERPEAMKEVIELASKRLEQRKQIANIRRAETMQKKFLSQEE